MNRIMTTKISADRDEALALVEKYFDGATSLSEERRLRVLLADTELTGEELDEARAVMGFVLGGKRSTSPRRLNRMLPAVGVAASVAVAVTVFASMLTSPSDGNVLMYEGGCRITDTHRVLSMVDSDLDAFGAAASDTEQQVSSDLKEISAIWN